MHAIDTMERAFC